MPIENAQYVKGFNTAYPVGSDSLGQADDHLRLIKQVLKNSLPNIDAPVTATPAAINGWEGRIAALEAQLAARPNQALPGTMYLWPSGGLPANHLPADGRLLNRHQYAALFAQYGTQFGFGDPTNFRIPDFRGFTLVCPDTMFGGPSARRFFNHGNAAEVGANTLSLGVHNLPSHTHAAWTDVQGNHSHSGYTSANGEHGHAASMDVQGSHDHYLGRVVIAEGGGSIGGGPLPYGAVGGARTDAQGAHFHNIVVNAAGNHQHALGIDPNGGHAHNVGVSAVGDGAPFPVVQVSKTCNVIIYTGPIAF